MKCGQSWDLVADEPGKSKIWQEFKLTDQTPEPSSNGQPEIRPDQLSHELTLALDAVNRGDANSADKLLQLVYDQLRT